MPACTLSVLNHLTFTYLLVWIVREALKEKIHPLIAQNDNFDSRNCKVFFVEIFDKLRRIISKVGGKSCRWQGYVEGKITVKKVAK